MAGNSGFEPLPSWRKFYKAALTEPDAQKLPSRIEEARRALVLRSREIFSNSPNYGDESEAIEDAMYALRALENCMALKTKDRRRAPRLD